MRVYNFFLKILLGLLFLFFAFIYTQEAYSVIELKPLNGFTAKPNKPAFNLIDWLSGAYQKAEEIYLNEAFGFRSTFIRINNQIRFSLFNKTNAKYVVIGKENFMYEEPYIHSYFGTNYLGKDSIEHFMKKMHFVNDTLGKLNKTLIFVFAPSKARFYTEYIPDKYVVKKKTGNYETYLKMAQKYRISYIDFNKYFLANKKKAQHPLYPKYGIHWSTYGSAIAADSIIKFIEEKRHIRLRHIYWKEIEVGTPRKGHDDNDIAEGLNVFFNYAPDNLAFPKMLIEPEEGKAKPSLLVVGDSYYWGIYSSGFCDAFTHPHFWYYNKRVYPESNVVTLETSSLKLIDEIDRNDIFILLSNEPNLTLTGWSFIDNLYTHFKGTSTQQITPEEKERKITNLMNYIRTDTNWMWDIRDKALASGDAVDSIIKNQATYIVEQELVKKK